MIVDSLNNSSIYESSNVYFQEIFRYLEKLSEDSNGKFVLEEGKVWGGISTFLETGCNEKLYEAHRDFIDIHYILSGEEKFGYSNIDRLQTKKPYDKENDCEVLNGDINYVKLRKGDFCVVFPNDAHIPVLEKVSEEPLIRVVVKVRMA